MSQCVAVLSGKAAALAEQGHTRTHIQQKKAEAKAKAKTEAKAKATQ